MLVVGLLLIAMPALAEDPPSEQPPRIGPLLLPSPTIEPDPVDPNEVTVVASHPLESPCTVIFERQRDLAMYPGRTPAEYLRSVPGMHMVPRLGHGAPWLYSYRGFDAGYGRDIAIEVEGVPINQPSHILGAGTVDLAFLPRAVISAVDFCPGATRSDTGSFATAASAHYHLGMDKEGVLFRLGGGSDGSGEAMLAWRPRGWERGTFILGEIDGGEGVGQDRGWRHLRLAAGIERTVGPVTATGFFMLSDNRNDVPIAVREDDVEAGRVRLLGGDVRWNGRHLSRRLLIGGRVGRPWSWGGVQAVGWLGASGFRNRDNTSGFLLDPVFGDGFELRQSSFEIGLRGKVGRAFNLFADQTWIEGGLDLQAHFLHQRDHEVDANGEVLNTRDDRWVESNTVAAWARTRIGLFQHARLVASVRIEQTELGVRVLDDGDKRGDVPQVGGSALAVAPKVSIVGEPTGGVTVHASFARGLRPPEARTVTRNAPLFGTRFDTLAGGVQVRPGRLLALSLDGFGTWSPAEHIRDQLDDRLLAVGPTRRGGVTATTTLWPLPRLRVDVDVNWTDARLRGGEPLPYVPRWTSAARVQLDQLPLGPILLTGGVRGWWVGRRRLPGGFSARGAAAFDVTARIDYGRWFFDGTVDNFVPYAWRYAEYVYPSRWDPEAPASPLPTRHIVPFEPAAIRVAFGARF